MSHARIESSLRDPGYTPRVRDVAELVGLLADDDLAKDAERAIARVGAVALGELKRRFEEARPPLKGRILRTIGRLVGHAEARSVLLGALEDNDPKTRRNAAIALGHARLEARDEAAPVEEALLAAWERDERVEMRRSVAAALGKVGTSRALARLREAAGAEDAELSRIASRSVLMIERTESRPSRGSLDAARAPDRALDVVAFARSGLEQLLAEELRAVGDGSGMPGISNVEVTGPGRVRARLSCPMTALFRARTMLSFQFRLPTETLRDHDTVEDAVARAATSEAARDVFSVWTVGAVRYRLAWSQGGHKRAMTWAVARSVLRRDPELVNDPTSSLWELLVTVRHRDVEVAIVPRALEDPRFVWRRRDVPAASHPTVAAALARVASARADDIVWDPFVGSGAELVERALLGPSRLLIGSDIDASALRAARENLDGAGVKARLERADALSYAPQGVTLVVTNPPMGRRASRTVGLADTLDRFVQHAATVLVPGGRLTWMAPWPARSRAAASRAGLKLDWAGVVDMGGFDAELQRWTRS